MKYFLLCCLIFLIGWTPKNLVSGEVKQVCHNKDDVEWVRVKPDWIYAMGAYPTKDIRNSGLKWFIH